MSGQPSNSRRGLQCLFAHVDAQHGKVVHPMVKVEQIPVNLATQTERPLFMVALHDPVVLPSVPPA